MRRTGLVAAAIAVLCALSMTGCGAGAGRRATQRISGVVTQSTPAGIAPTVPAQTGTEGGAATGTGAAATGSGDLDAQLRSVDDLQRQLDQQVAAADQSPKDAD